LTVLFANDWGPDQRDREVHRWYACLNSGIGLSECGPLTGKPFASSSSQDVNPATSLSPFAIHCDLRTEENKYSRSERSGFAGPAHIAAETSLATHRRTRCALKRFADRSQPTLLGMLLSTGASGPPLKERQIHCTRQIDTDTGQSNESCVSAVFAQSNELGLYASFAAYVCSVSFLAE